MNIFKFLSPLKAQIDKLLGKIKDPQFRAGVEQAAVEVIGFADVARPIIEALAKATPTAYDDLAVRGAVLIGQDIKVILEMPRDERGPYLRDMARELLRGKLLGMVLSRNSDVVVNGVRIVTADQVRAISNSVLNKVIEFAYDAIKKAATAQE